MIMLPPLWVSHSRQAASQARQPMQREGSMNMVLMAMPISDRSGREPRLAGFVREHSRRACRSEVDLRCPGVARLSRLQPLDGRRTRLELRDLHAGIDGGVRELVDGLPVPVVERDKQCV